MRPFKSVSALVIIITSTSCREPGPLKAMYDKLYTLQFTDNDHSLQGQCDTSNTVIQLTVTKPVPALWW